MEDVAEICIDVRDRFVQIAPSEDGQIHITYAESDKESYELSLSDDQVLTMTSSNNKEWKDYIGGKTAEVNREILLEIPDAAISNLTISTTNETISISPLTLLGNVSLSSNGGSVCFDSLAVGQSITLSSKNGDITGSIVGGYDDFSIACTVKKGDSNLPSSKQGGTKSLFVEANNGDISIDFLVE